MSLCLVNSALLGNSWALDLVKLHAEKQNNVGKTAFIYLLCSENAEKADIYSEAFKMLFERERDLRDDNGTTPLMHLCANNP